MTLGDLFRRVLRSGAATIPSDIIVLDLESQRGPSECGGWSNVQQFGLAVAVTWDSDEGFREWFEPDVKPLIQHLARFTRVVDLNLLRFDYRVLSAYEPNVSRILRGSTRDILDDVYRRLGFRVSLNDLAQATLGRAKSGDGAKAIQWWKEGKRDLVVKYCCEDVALTRDLHNFGAEHGLIYYPSYRAKRSIAINWR